MNLKRHLSAALLFAGGTLAILRADDWPGTFQAALPRPTANPLNSVVFDGGAFHALGQWGTHLSSTDGVAWTVEAPASTDDLSGYAELGQVRVITGVTHFDRAAEGWAGVILTSMDSGTTWLRQVLATGQDFKVQSLDGQFIGTGRTSSPRKANIYRSIDGVNWVQANLPAEVTNLDNTVLGEIVYAAGKYVVTGGVILDAPAFALTSTDGIAWDYHEISGDRPLIQLAYGGGVFVAADTPAGRDVATSIDGVTWTTSSDSRNRHRIVYANGNFLSLGTDASSPSPLDLKLFKSPDGVNWSTVALTEPVLPFYLESGNGVVVSAGGEGMLFTSTTGEDWTWRAGPARPPRRPELLLFGGGNFVVTSSLSDPPMISPDGLNWNQAAFGDETSLLYGAAHGTGGYAAIGTGPGPVSFPPRIVHSTDGNTWSSVEVPAGVTELNEIVFGGDENQETFLILAASDDDPVILTSTDGQLWSDNTPTSGPFAEVTPNGVLAGDGSLLLLAANSLGTKVVLSSANGLHWSLSPITPPATSEGLIFRNDRYFAADVSPGWLHVSDDGIQWQTTKLPPDTRVRDISFGFGLYLAAAWGPNAGTVLFSEDAWNWRELPGLDGRVWQGIAYANKGFNLLSRGGAILRLDLSTVRSRLAGQRLAGGTMNFNLLSQPGEQVQLYQSPDLGSWNPMRTINVVEEVTPISEPASASPGGRFWKAEPVTD